MVWLSQPPPNFILVTKTLLTKLITPSLRLLISPSFPRNNPHIETVSLPIHTMPKQFSSCCCNLGRLHLGSFMFYGISNLFGRRNLDHHRVTVCLLVDQEDIDPSRIRLKMYLILG
jgi:hypothetical protein